MESPPRLAGIRAVPGIHALRLITPELCHKQFPQADYVGASSSHAAAAASVAASIAVDHSPLPKKPTLKKVKRLNRLLDCTKNAAAGPLALVPKQGQSPPLLDERLRLDDSPDPGDEQALLDLRDSWFYGEAFMSTNPVLETSLDNKHSESCSSETEDFVASLHALHQLRVDGASVNVLDVSRCVFRSYAVDNVLQAFMEWFDEEISTEIYYNDGEFWLEIFALVLANDARWRSDAPMLVPATINGTVCPALNRRIRAFRSCVDAFHTVGTAHSTSSSCGSHVTASSLLISDFCKRNICSLRNQVRARVLYTERLCCVILPVDDALSCTVIGGAFASPVAAYLECLQRLSSVFNVVTLLRMVLSSCNADELKHFFLLLCDRDRVFSRTAYADLPPVSGGHRAADVPPRSRFGSLKSWTRSVADFLYNLWGPTEAYERRSVLLGAEIASSSCLQRLLFRYGADMQRIVNSSWDDRVRGTQILVRRILSDHNIDSAVP